jgi:hypothetical protein
MALYFPQQKESGKVKQQYSRLKERAFLDAQMLSTTAPQQFWGPNGVEAKTIVNFEDICIGLSQHVPKDPKAMTVLEFYRALEAVKKKVKAQQRRLQIYTLTMVQ